MDQKKPHVVFIPFPAQSHIKCMLKLAKVLNHKGFDVTFINTQTNHKRLVKSGGTCWLNDTPNFHFKTVPDGSATEDDVEQTQTAAEIWSYMGSNFYDSFLDIVSGLETPVTCIVCDGFMTYTNTMNAAEELKIPIILFWTMAACGFMGFYQVKVLMEKGFVPIKDESVLNEYLEVEVDWIPGMEGTLLKDLPEIKRYSKPNDDAAFKYLLETAQAADNASHIIIHTFEELEARLVKEIKSIFHNIYAIGPLQSHLNQITAGKETENLDSSCYSLWKEEPECIQWLQSKAPNSVVYVNFGSIAVMSLQDLEEFGWGLVNSNINFLWIIRADLVDGEPTVLPQELKEAMSEKGFVASWCSQEEVLNHPSVGGFLTHGGWGSIIESLLAGVPMICWPVSGDQQINCRQMCKEWGVGMEIAKKVNKDEVEMLVRELMEGVEGERMRKKAMEWKKTAETAVDCDGSSWLDLEKLANLIKNL